MTAKKTPFYSVIRIESGSPVTEASKLSRATAARIRLALYQVPGTKAYMVPDGVYESIDQVLAASLVVRPRRPRRLDAERYGANAREGLTDLRAVGYRALAADLVASAIDDLEYMVDMGLVVNGRVVDGHPGWRAYPGIEYITSPATGAETVLAFLDGTLDEWLRDAGYVIPLDAVRARCGLPAEPTEEDILLAMWDCLTQGQRAKLPIELFPKIYQPK